MRASGDRRSRGGALILSAIVLWCPGEQLRAQPGATRTDTTSPATQGSTSKNEPQSPGTVIQELQTEMRDILRKFDDSIGKFIEAQQPSIGDARKFIDEFSNQHRDFLTGFGPGSARMRAIENALEFAKSQQDRISKKSDLTEVQKKALLDQWAKMMTDAQTVIKNIGDNNAALEELAPRLKGYRGILVEYEILRRYGDALSHLKEMSSDLVRFRQKIEELLKSMPETSKNTN